MDKIPDWVLREEEVRCVLERGYDPLHLPRSGFRGYFARPEELAPLHESEGFETIAVAAAEPGIGPMDEAYNRLEGELRARWLDLLYAVSTEPSMLGASRHLLYLGRRGAEDGDGAL